MVAIRKNIKCTIKPEDLLAAVVWNPAAPSLNIDLLAAAQIIEKKRDLRKAGIAKVLENNKSKGKSEDAVLAAILYDSEHAPFSTNRKQLAELGVKVPKNAANLAEDEVTRFLWAVINGLALLGIYTVGTNHLDDRAMLDLLLTRILEEQIRDVPPNADMSEFLDLARCSPLSGEEIEDPDMSRFDRDSLTPRPNRSLPTPA